MIRFKLQRESSCGLCGVWVVMGRDQRQGKGA